MAKKDPFREKAEVYEILANILFKFILIVAAIGAFFWILYMFFKEDFGWNKASYAAIDLILGGSLYKVYTHHFPDPSKKST